MLSLVRINFNQNLINDIDAHWAIYFENANGALFGNADAVVVEDVNNIPMTGFVSATTSGFNDNNIEFTYDYDNNAQNGRTPGTDAQVFIVGCGINIAKYVVLRATIKNQAVNNFILAADKELYYGG